MIKLGMMIGERYEILEKIGTGGMSDVYKAMDHKLNRSVAIKILKQEFSENESFVSKFRVEAQAAAGLMHANIVNVYDVGEERGIYYIVMELVEGITLKKYIEKKSRLSVKEAISIAIQVSLGIEAAHHNHIIHRDIKPQNIMISREGRVKVTDFGIAKAATSNTITSNVMGSVHYTSPEQARGGYSDAKSDIYSLGITLFEMLTGRVPFNGDTTVAIAIKHIQEKMPSPCEFVPEIPVSVEQIVLKCTQKSPDARYQSMSELVEDLKRSLITPDENFVVMNGANVNGETRMLEGKDAISRKTLQKEQVSASSPERMRLNENAQRKKDPMPVRTSQNTRSGGSRTQSAGKAQSGRQTGGGKKQSKSENNSTAERLITLAMVVIALVIVGIVIYIVGQMLGGTPADKTTDGAGATSKPTQYTTPAPTNNQMMSSEMTEVPDVSSGGRFTQAEATKTLIESGFDVVVDVSYSEVVKKGYVISQTPAAGERDVQIGSKVTLLISAGKDISTVTVPYMLGHSLEEAVQMLEAVGLELGEVSESHHDTYLPGEVCYQNYLAGGSVDEGTKVNLTLSLGALPHIYSCNYEVSAPNDEAYNGSTVTVKLIGSDGIIYHNTATNIFPIVINVSGIPVSSGIVEMEYVVSAAAATTDADGNQVIGIRDETRKEQRSILFILEE